MQAQLGLTGYSDAEEIGRGGFGVVYRARQVSLNRMVAIKVLPSATMGEQTRKRFERECRAMAALADHPNIVSIFEHGIAEESRRPFIVMEYVSGGSLAARGEIDWQRALEIGIKLCGALETAHRAGILHRDLKPENVLVSAFGQVMLADFGVAKVQDSSETPTGNITASILHAAPELLTGQRPEIATDVYSLASTIYSLILGRAPFARPDEESLAPLITRICLEQPPDLTAMGVPEAVSTILERGLAKEPAERFDSALDFGQAMQQAQRALGLPVTEIHVAADLTVAADPTAVPRQRPPEVFRPDATTAARKLTPAELGIIGGGGGGGGGGGAREPGGAGGAQRPPRRSRRVLASLTALVVLAFAGSGILIANLTGDSQKTSASSVIPGGSTASGAAGSTSGQAAGGTKSKTSSKSGTSGSTGSDGGSSTSTGGGAGSVGSATDGGGGGTLIAGGGGSTGSSTDGGSTGGTGSNGTTGGTTGTTTGGTKVRPKTSGGSTVPAVVDPGPTTPTTKVTKSTAPAAQPFVDHAPSVFASSQTSNETTPLVVNFTASDPDAGDHATISVSGLPAGLSANGGQVTGAISYTAANGTSNRTNIASSNFPVTVTATDTHGKSTSRVITWTVRDTARTMPNYIGQFGCGGCGGLPDVNAISTPVFDCAYDPNGTNQLIWRQSVAPGSVITWGQNIEYWYGKNDTSCPHVAQGW
ncbi:MAG TPA: protein kinase [Frankiaceae bacterium]|jgi:predicted Ser/Thr protein kinase|nr:protein kinase [Frankiaceae bacterium]